MLDQSRLAQVVSERRIDPEHEAELRPSPPEAGPSQELARFLLWLLAGVLSLVIAWLLVLQLWIVPTLRISRVMVDSDIAWPVPVLLNLAGLEEGALYFRIDEALAAENLARQALVKSVEVRKQFPDTLSITLRARKPLVQHILGDGTVVLIDEEGVAFDYVQTRTAYDLPILSGIEFRNFVQGTRLPDFLGPFLKDLAQLREGNPALFQAFSEFRLEPKRSEEIEVLCFTSQTAVPVRINARLGKEGAIMIMRVLDMLAAGDGFGTIREIDFRSRNVIVKKGDD